MRSTTFTRRLGECIPVRCERPHKAAPEGESRVNIGFDRGLSILTALVWPISAAAQPQFVNVAAAKGLIHGNPYHQTFAFPVERWRGIAGVLTVMQANMGNGAGVTDFDHDGDFDVYLLNQLGLPNHFFRNDVVDGARRFTDITAMVGLGDTGLGRASLFADLDNDGWQDVILINDDDPTAAYPPSKVFRSVGGRFVDVTADSGIPALGFIKGGACLGDYDADGLLDLYVGVWLFQGARPTPLFSGNNHLFHNLGGMLFEDVTATSGVGVFGHDTYSCVFADFDNDGDADLYVAVDHASDLYLRNEGGTFVNDTVAVGATHTGNDMGLGVADFDDDGDLDVYSTNITDLQGGFGTTDFNTLLVNQLTESGQLRFVDQAEARAVQNTYWGWGTEFVDVDNDSDLDLYAVNGFDQFVASGSPSLVDTPEVMFVNDGTGHFAAAIGCGADFVGDARAAIAFDYDLDGDQDLLVTNVNEATVLLENRSPDQGHWLDVRLVGSCGFNADAVGGRVYVTVGERTQMREVIAGGSYLSGRSLEQHFGLGEASSIDELRIVWPNRTEASFTDVAANQRILVLQGGDAGESSWFRVPAVVRDLRDVAAFQRCFGGTDPSCAALDTASPQGVDAADLGAFLDSLRWPLPGCSPR